MQVEREVMVNSYAEFVCPADVGHPFEYLIDHIDGDQYVWVYAICCDEEAPFWLVVAPNVAAQHLQEDLERDLHWQEELAQLIVSGQIAEIHPHTWLSMVVEVAKHHDREPLRETLQVPEGVSLFDWVRDADREGRLQLIALYAGDSGAGKR